MIEADRLRALWRQHSAECARVNAENEARHRRFMAACAEGRRSINEGRILQPPFPSELHELRCGARTRKGEPCKRRDLYGPSGRCKLHGGLSTGPKSAEGKARAQANLLLRHVRPEPHATSTNVEVGEEIDANGAHQPKIEPAALVVSPDQDSGGMAPDAILAAIGAVAAKRRSRR